MADAKNEKDDQYFSYKNFAQVSLKFMKIFIKNRRIL